MGRHLRKIQAVKHHVWPGDTPEKIRAFNESYNFDLNEFLAEIERTAGDILAAANFPKTLKPPFTPPDVVLKRQIEERGFDWESREGYAVRILYQTWLVRTALPKPAAVAIHDWGTPEERESKKNEIRQLYNDVRTKCRSKEDAYKAVARQTSVTPRTVRRVITGN